MGWSISYDTNWERDIGYGVSAFCDFPKCKEVIDRGLSYVCGGEFCGGDYGCGLYFCGKHFQYRKPHDYDQTVQLCPRCFSYKKPYEKKSEYPKWLRWKLSDESWDLWRKKNPKEVEEIKLKLINS